MRPQFVLLLRNQSDAWPFPLSYQVFEGSHLNSRNGLYVLIGVLVVTVIGLGAYIYREESKPQGIEMSIGKNGVSIEQN